MRNQATRNIDTTAAMNARGRKMNMIISGMAMFILMGVIYSVYQGVAYATARDVLQHNRVWLAAAAPEMCKREGCVTLNYTFKDKTGKVVEAYWVFQKAAYAKLDQRNRHYVEDFFKDLRHRTDGQETLAFHEGVYQE